MSIQKLFYSVSRDRGNFDDGYDDNEYESVDNNTTSTLEIKEWKPTFKPKPIFQPTKVNIGQQPTTFKTKGFNPKKNDHQTFKSPFNKSRQNAVSNSKESSNVQKRLHIYTEQTLDVAPRVFFNPMRIYCNNPIITALKHDNFLREKSLVKSFDTHQSSSFEDRTISHNSVFEIRPNFAL